MPNTWDIFCGVVDNYGDIGVCWRLARQLAAEHGAAVRLWVDDLDSFHRLCPAIDAQRPLQTVDGIEVRHWREPMPAVEPADVVVEGFGSRLPEAFVAAMAARSPQPVWINLEYLSAEAWVEGCHGLPSPHARLPLVKYFFFPGFTEKTGGLLIERGLQAQREAFQRDPDAQTEFWRNIGIAPPVAGELRLSLFAYDNPALPALIDVWAAAPAPTLCVVPQGKSLTQLSALTGIAPAPGASWRKGSLEIRAIPFLPQAQYDRLLWACDFNFVRGEDSFVRAQLAARPFAWHIYPQEDEVHLAKLRAFLALYCRGLPAQAAAGLSAFWEAWNQGLGPAAAAEAWSACLEQRAVLDGYARVWAAGLGAHGDLAGRLALFCQNRLK